MTQSGCLAPAPGGCEGTPLQPPPLHQGSPPSIYCTWKGNRLWVHTHGGLVPITGSCPPAPPSQLAKASSHPHCHLTPLTTGTWAAPFSAGKSAGTQGSAGDPRGHTSSVPAHQQLLPAQAIRLPHVFLPAGGNLPLLLQGKGLDASSQGFYRNNKTTWSRRALKSVAKIRVETEPPARTGGNARRATSSSLCHTLHAQCVIPAYLRPQALGSAERLCNSACTAPSAHSTPRCSPSSARGQAPCWAIPPS